MRRKQCATFFSERFRKGPPLSGGHGFSPEKCWFVAVTTSSSLITRHSSRTSFESLFFQPFVKSKPLDHIMTEGLMLPINRNFYTMSLRPFNGKTLTTFRAGLALKTVSSPVNGLIPLRALVAGLRTTLTFIIPGTLKTPGPRLPRFLPISFASSSKTLATCLLVRPVFSANVAMISVLVMGFCAAPFGLK